MCCVSVDGSWLCLGVCAKRDRGQRKIFEDWRWFSKWTVQTEILGMMYYCFTEQGVNYNVSRGCHVILYCLLAEVEKTLDHTMLITACWDHYVLKDCFKTMYHSHISLDLQHTVLLLLLLLVSLLLITSFSLPFYPLSVSLCLCLCVCVSLFLSLSLPLSVCLSVCLSLCVCLSVCLQSPPFHHLNTIQYKGHTFHLSIAYCAYHYLHL